MKPPSFFAALNLAGKRCLLVGSGAEAERRVRALIECAAEVVLIAHEPTTELCELAAQGKLTLHRRRFLAEDMQSTWLAVLAERDAPLAAEMAQIADKLRVFFCAIDQPIQNSFAHMALARSGCVTAAISTEGRAPGLGRKLRDELYALFQRASLAEFAEEISDLRSGAALEERAQLLHDAVEGVRIEGELRLRR